MQQAIYFDLDGTLTDPKTGITRSIQYALEKLAKPVPAANELTWCIGPPLLESFESLVGDAELAPQALDIYRQRFSTIGLFENEVYPGIEAMLQALREQGRPLYVATSKPCIYAERILEHFGLAKYFSAVFGAELDGARSDKSELLAYALAETAHSAENSIMVGDRKHDMIGACNNGLTALGVLWGYGDEQEILTAGASAVFATVDDLKSHLTGDPA